MLIVSRRDRSTRRRSRCGTRHSIARSGLGAHNAFICIVCFAATVPATGAAAGALVVGIMESDRRSVARTRRTIDTAEGNELARGLHHARATEWTGRERSGDKEPWRGVQRDERSKRGDVCIKRTEAPETIDSDERMPLSGRDRSTTRAAGESAGLLHVSPRRGHRYTLLASEAGRWFQ